MFLSNKEGITPIDILVVNIQHLDSQREQQNPRKDVRYYESIFQAKSIEDKVQTLGCFLCDILKQRQVGGLNKKLKQRLASNLPDKAFEIVSINEENGKRLVTYRINVFGLDKKVNTHSAKTVDKKDLPLELKQVL